MQDWGKPRRPGRERSRPPARDPRADSAPPASTEEAPLRTTGRPPSSRPRPEGASRVAALEADLERLKAERAQDADQVGEMLVRIAAAERAREAAEARVAAAEQQAAALSAEIARLKARYARLEAESWDPGAAGGAEVEAARGAMTRVAAILDELDRREEMAAGIRARTFEQMRQALAEAEAPASPPLRPSPVIDVQPPAARDSMTKPGPFPTE